MVLALGSRYSETISESRRTNHATPGKTFSDAQFIELQVRRVEGSGEQRQQKMKYEDPLCFKTLYENIIIYFKSHLPRKFLLANYVSVSKYF